MEEKQHAPRIRLHDLAPKTADFRADVLEGLRRPQKEISAKYLYDARGSELFEKICTQEEYYPTRTEISIMNEHGAEMAALLESRCRVVEPGSGAGVKTRLLLDLMEGPVAFVPVEISREFLLRSVEELANAYPEIQMQPVCADFTQPFTLPPTDRDVRRTVVYFPGSTIGNFPVAGSLSLLKNLGRHCAGDGGLLIGVDLKKDVARIEAAYNDKAGVTAQFNLNLLTRMNRELGADFKPDRFEHHAFWNDENGCIEAHIRSREPQTVTVAGESFSFEEGETVHTEYSHKYSLDEFATLAGKAGLAVDHVWTDSDNLFSVQLCTPA